MFRVVADKLFLNLMEKNRFVCECISLSSINHVAICFFSESFFRREKLSKTYLFA